MTLQTRDHACLWHPCAQMKDYENFPPIEIVHANGDYLYTRQGDRIIDAIASWWCKALGHRRPELMQALVKQTEQFEHVILANTTNETIVELSEALLTLSPVHSKVLYAGDGSSAVEMAIKMAVHAQAIAGRAQRQQLCALENGYHGETALTLSVSDCGIYRDPYQPLLTPCHFIRNIPYVSGEDDPLFHDVSALWPSIEAQLLPVADSLAAIIVEPIIQGAGGMKIYSADFLRRLAHFAKANDIYFICDEIMTGFGRTGKAMAYQHAGIEPDAVVVGKGLTAGVLPMSAVMISEQWYQMFYADYGSGRDFLHSHTHSGNALAAAVAKAALEVYQQQALFDHVANNSNQLRENMQAVATATGALSNLRQLGWIVAADYNSDQPRAGYQVYQQAIKLGALLRPLGNTVYWFPPLTIAAETLAELRDITIAALNQCML